MPASWLRAERLARTYMDEVIIIIICLILNALFAAYEMAFVSVPRAELRGAARRGDKAAQKLVSLRDNPERTLSIIQIGITMVGAIAAAVGGAGAAENLEPYFMQTVGLNKLSAQIISVIIIVLPITYLTVVVGELVPKTLALRNPMRIVIGGAKALFIADRILSPLVTVLEWSTKKILSTFFRRAKPKSEDESQTSIDIDQFSPVHRTFMLNMAEIEKKKIRDILLPWTQVNHVKSTDPIETVTQMVLSSGHTRLPVTDNGHVVGVLHTKEFLTLKESGARNWQSIIRPPLRVRPSDSALGVLRMMQEKRNHMTIVFSAAGERIGIVTLEDILEEVVGDIFDEDDDGKIRRVFASKPKSRVIPGDPSYK